MLDRLTNLCTLLVAGALVIVLFSASYRAWNHTPPWDRDWKLKEGKSIPYTADQLSGAARNATAASDEQAAERLENVLRESYEPNPGVRIRISWPEAVHILSLLFWTSLVFVLPISLNYVRHGRFRVWNRGA